MTLDEPVIEEDVKNIVERTVKNEKYTKLSIDIEQGSNLGDGFVSVTCAVIVIIDDVKRSYFLKMAPKDSRMREAMLIRPVFEREIFFNDKIVPAIDAIYFKHTGNHLNVTPSCYFTSQEESKEVLVLENLNVKGFDVNRNDCFDSDHLKLVLKAFSRLHATGFMLRREDPELFANTQQKTTNLKLAYLKKFKMSTILLRYFQIISGHCDPNEDKVILDRLESIKAATYDSLKAFEFFDYGEYTTIVQQDSWRFNCMFKYRETGIPEEVRLIDFQIFNITSPIEDVLFCFYTSASSIENMENLNYFLEYYYDNLKEELKMMGGDVDLVYPRSIFEAHMKIYNPFALACAICFVYDSFAKPEELPNMVQLLKENTPESDLFLYEIEAKEAYSKRIKEVIYHFINNNLL